MDSKNRLANGESTGSTRVGSDPRLETDGGYANEPDVGEWATLFAAIGALVGVVVSVHSILTSELDMSMVDGGSGTYYWSTLSLPRIALALAVLFGLYLAWNRRLDESAAYTIAGGASLAGVLVLTLVLGLVQGTESDLSLDVAGLVVNAVTISLAVAVVAVGTVWIGRSMGPSDVWGR